MRLFNNLGDRIRNGETVYIEIPHVGLFVTRKNVVGVKFEDHLIQDTRVKNSKTFCLCLIRLY